jgi:hypothetical protein
VPRRSRYHSGNVSRDQLKRAASLTEEDFVQLGKCRRPHNRLGFAYQVAFVRLFDRFPQQQPFELFEELVCFSAAQLGLDAELIELGVSSGNGILRTLRSAVSSTNRVRRHLMRNAEPLAQSSGFPVPLFP